MTKKKTLTSAGFFFAPGIFKAMQHDYKIGSGLKTDKEHSLCQKAAAIISEGWDIPLDEAAGLLSGRIPTEIDFDTGSITYTVEVPEDLDKIPAHIKRVIAYILENNSMVDSIRVMWDNYTEESRAELLEEVLEQEEVHDISYLEVFNQNYLTK